MMTLKVWNTLSKETKADIIRLCGYNATEGLLEAYHHNFDYDTTGKRLKAILECCYLRPSDKKVVVSIEIAPKFESNATKQRTATITRKKGVDYVAEVSKSFSAAVQVLPDMIKKFGRDKKILRVSKTDFHWNHRVDDFTLGKGGKIWVSIYWQGDSTDGNDDVLLNEFNSRSEYVIPADNEFLGNRTCCRHGDLRVTREEVWDAIKLAAASCQEEAKKKNVTDDPSKGHKVTFTKSKDGKVLTRESGASLLDVVNYVHHETVRHCEYCGKPMSRSDVNDYGTLCERCYMKEYYNE